MVAYPHNPRPAAHFTPSTRRAGKCCLFLISSDKNYAVYLHGNQLVLLNKLIYASSVAFYPFCVVSDSP